MPTRDRSRREDEARRISHRRSGGRQAGKRTSAALPASRRVSSLLRLRDLDAVLQSVRALGYHDLTFSEPVEDLDGGFVSTADRHVPLARNVTRADHEDFVAFALGNERYYRNNDGSWVHSGGDLAEDRLADSRGLAPGGVMAPPCTPRRAGAA